jgi:hypothetical protein
MLSFALGTLLAASGGLATFALAHVATSRWLDEAPLRLRGLGAFVLVCWGQALAFYMLIGLGQFHRGAVATLGALVLGAIVWWLRRASDLRRQCLDDVDTLRDAVARALGPRIRWLTALVGLFVVGDLLRHLAAPPVDWDSLLYHLPRAAEWVQHGELARLEAPGVFSYTNYYLPVGDVWSAWAMIPVHSDALLPVAWGAVWGASVLAIYSLARQFGATRLRAYLAALAAGLLPMLTAHAFTSYVDPLVAALVLTSFALYVYMVRAKRAAASVLAIIALATALVVKRTALPFAAPGLVLFFDLLRRDHRERLWTYLGAGAAGCAAVTVPVFGYLWWQTGSPVYPDALAIDGVVLFEGNAEYEWIHANYPVGRLPKYLWRLVWEGYGVWYRHVNLGPYAPVLAILGLGAMLRTMREHRVRPVVATYMAASAFAAYLVLTHIHNTGLHIARYMAAVPCLLIAFAATLEHRSIPWLLGLGIAIDLVYFLPDGWSRADLVAVGHLAAVGLPFALVAGLIVWWGEGESRAQRVGAYAAAVGVLVLAAATVLEPTRATHRHAIYRQASLGHSYTNFPVTGGSARSFTSSPIWKALDQPDEPSTVAAIFGWDGRGIHWFVHPLYGRRLQNDVRYVPVTADGESIAHRLEDERRERASYEAWRRRLLEQNVDYVAAFAPVPLETRWMEEYSDHFELVEVGLDQRNRLYRVRQKSR